MPDFTAKLTTVVSRGSVTMSDVWINGGMMLLCALGSMIAAFACSYFTVKIACSFSKELRTRMFTKINSFTGVEMKKFSTHKDYLIKLSFLLRLTPYGLPSAVENKQLALAFAQRPKSS